jgi:hypothetical protein
MENTYDSVKNYYGKVLASSKDLKTSACTASGRPHPLVRQLINKVPSEINDRFYGCGAPIPLGIEGRGCAPRASTTIQQHNVSLYVATLVGFALLVL